MTVPATSIADVLYKNRNKSILLFRGIHTTHIHVNSDKKL